MRIIVKPAVNYGIAFAELNQIIKLNQIGSAGVPAFTYQLDPSKRSIDIQLQDDQYIMDSNTMSQFAIWMQIFSI